MLAFYLIVVRKLEKFQHSVRRVIERQDIERNVHVPIVIDPFRSNRFFVEREWCWNIGVHRAKLWLVPRIARAMVWRLKSRQSDLRMTIGIRCCIRHTISDEYFKSDLSRRGV